jgi:Lon protease-like protein
MSETLPMFPLTTVLFPGMRLPLHIFEQRYRQLVRDLLDQTEPRRFGVIAIRKGRETGADGVTALHEVGCVATVRQVKPLDDGQYDLVVVGTERFRLLALDRSLTYFQGEIESLTEEVSQAQDGARIAALAAQRVQVAFRAYLNALADRGGGVITVADLPDEPLLLSYIVAAAMIIDLPERQALLAAERSLLAREIGMLRATTSRPAPDFTRERYSPN